PRPAEALALAHSGAGAHDAPASPVPQSLQVLRDGEVLELDLEDYLFGVVAAEMPASFPSEALKAQAVAARTYALWCAAQGKHPQAQVCTDPGCCQAWLSEEALRERWGEDYARYAAKIRDAVAATAGQVLRYEGAPVFAAFHSSSPGATEDSGALWEALPYLVSVPSPETEADVPGYSSVLRCSPLDFRDTVLSARPLADLSGPEEDWIGQLRQDESGRVAALVLGGAELSGQELRRLFSLRSTAFSLTYEDGWFVFDVRGYGHGVGMSQYGAKVLAEQGATYREILAHYYPGTELYR
ncbi:MAG: stage II sporulation protein D, partial [Oscillospiraceae bacterium]|nr:stage II sporulation protein D [Oscillospiraceae bacterium]